MPQKPSEFIQSILPKIAEGRMEEVRKQMRSSGNFTLLSQGQEIQIQSQLCQDPMTWVMAIMTFLDHVAQNSVEAEGKLNEQLNDLRSEINHVIKGPS